MCLRAMVLGVCLVGWFSSSASAQEPPWWGVVIARGEDQSQIESTPIVQRPYRPLHFYGNTIRRQYYRGNPWPLPRDFVQGAQAFVFRRRVN